MTRNDGAKAVTVTTQEVNRVLEAGRLLLSVLTPEELAELASVFPVHGNYERWLKVTPPESGATGES